LSFFKELKRRNVFRVGAAYIVVGWLLLEVSENLAPALRLPEWFHSGVAFLLILGFPVALVFAWAFIVGLLVLALSYIAYDKFVLDSKQDVAPEDVTPESFADEQVAQAAIENKSIAVLPFVNMSADADQEYFSDGLAEEVLNLLARVPELRVIARTSSFSYKGKDITIADVARELNVAHVLEGSVRKAGNQLRITAQLIRAEDSSHLWSQTWDRALEDIFAIQDEIASEVTARLKVSLLGRIRQEVDPEVYAMYLQARQLTRQETVASFKKANELYLRALDIAPDYAAAWQGLGVNYNLQTNHGLLPFNEGRAKARDAAQRALEIDPDFAGAHNVLGWSSVWSEGGLQLAARHFQRSIELDHTNPAYLIGPAYLVENLGRQAESVDLLEYVVERDPVNPGGYYQLGMAYRFAGRFEDAINALRTALNLTPGSLSTRYRIGEALLLMGDARAALAEFRLEAHEGWRLPGEVMALHALGQDFESDAALARFIELNAQEAAYNIAYCLAYRNEVDRAFEWLDKAVQNNDSGLSDINKEQLFANIHDDPRWLPLLRRLGRAPDQLAAIEFEVLIPD
jgi:TolB-like protein